MPEIIQNKDGGKIIFSEKDFSTGFLPNWNTSTTLNQIGTGLASSRSMNPFRFYPYATPGYLPADVTNVAQVASLIRNGVINGTSAYLISNGALVHELTNLNGTPAITNAGAFPHTITPTGGTTPLGNDCIIYSAKTSGTTAITSNYFYSYTSSTIWNVGCYVNFTTFDDDFMSSAAVTTPLAADYTTGGKDAPHPMIVGDDDILYMGDRNFLHAFDGTGGTAAATKGKFYPAVLTLPYGYIITSFAKLPNSLLIFTYLNNPIGSSTFYSGKAVAWVWNYNDLDITRSYDLNDNYVGEAFAYQNTIGCFTQGTSTDPGSSKSSQLKLFDGNQFKPVASFIGNVPIKGGVDIVGDVINFNSSGIIYSYGSPILEVKAGLNKLSEGVGTTSGFLRTLTSTLQVISSGATTSGGLEYLGSSDNYYFQTLISTGLAEPTFPDYKKGRTKNVKIRFGKTSTGGRNIIITLRNRGTGASEIISSVENLTEIDTAGKMVIDRNNDTSNNPLIDFDSLKLIVQWGSGSGATDAPVLARVEVDYENINI